MNYYNLSDLICKIKVAYKLHLLSIKVLKNKLSIKFLYLIYKLGLIRCFFILKNENNIIVYLKYLKSCLITLLVWTYNRGRQAIQKLCRN